MGLEGEKILQGAESVQDRVARDTEVRLFQKPRVPPAPTLATASFQLGDGSTVASVTVTWTPVRKDIDTIVRWKKSTDTNYTYERAKTSPHIIRPVETNVTVNVALAAEFSKTGARSGFTADVNIVSAQDTVAPATPTGVTATIDNTSGTIILSWTPNTEGDLGYYQVQRSTVTGGETDYRRVGGTAFQDGNITVGTQYFYKVKAVDRSTNASAASAEVNGTVAFVGTVSTTAITSATTDPGAAFTTATTQLVTFPAGSNFLNARLTVTNVTLVGGADTLTVRFSIGSPGSSSSNTSNLAFSSAGQSLSVELKTLVTLGTSGELAFLCEWLDVTGNTSTFQMTSPGSIRVSAT